MADFTVKAGNSDVSLVIRLWDNATNGPATGLVISDLDFTYIRPGSTATKIDLAALTTVSDTHTDNYAIELDATNAPGKYRLDLPDAVCATGIDITSYTINDSNGDEIGTGVISLGGITNVTQWNGTNVATPEAAGYPAVTVKVGTGTGEINLSSGKVPVDLSQALSEAPTGLTVGEALYAALSANAYKLAISGTTLTLYKSDASTAWRTFTLDSASNPTSRTPD